MLSERAQRFDFSLPPLGRVCTIVVRPGLRGVLAGWESAWCSQPGHHPVVVVNGVRAETARHLRVAAMGLHRAGVDLAGTVERLCDHDLADHERAADTERLYAALTHVRLALSELVGRADTDTVDPTVVLTVSGGRWDRGGW